MGAGARHSVGPMCRTALAAAVVQVPPQAEPSLDSTTAGAGTPSPTSEVGCRPRQSRHRRGEAKEGCFPSAFALVRKGSDDSKWW